MRGTCEIQDTDQDKRQKTRRLRGLLETSERRLLEDGRDYDMLSCPAHVVNKLGNLLVFETEKLKKLKKYIHVPGLWRYVAYAREKFWNMRCVHGMYMYIV